MTINYLRTLSQWQRVTVKSISFTSWIAKTRNTYSHRVPVADRRARSSTAMKVRIDDNPTVFMTMCRLLFYQMSRVQSRTTVARVGRKKLMLNNTFVNVCLVSSVWSQKPSRHEVGKSMMVFVAVALYVVLGVQTRMLQIWSRLVVIYSVTRLGDLRLYCEVLRTNERLAIGRCVPRCGIIANAPPPAWAGAIRCMSSLGPIVHNNNLINSICQTMLEMIRNYNGCTHNFMTYSASPSTSLC